jgi:hypothetical protein
MHFHPKVVASPKLGAMIAQSPHSAPFSYHSSVF